VDRVDLKAMNRAELVRWFADELGESPVRATRVYQWIWQRGARTFGEMVGVPQPLRDRLEASARLPWLDTALELTSSDGTRKFLWRLHDGHTIESVLIPDGDRVTLCVSSQVGCAMACTFCVTGDMGLKRHLSASEIAGQVLQVQGLLPEGERITNLVLMGMGEPLHNLRALVPALENCLDDFGLKFSHRRITVSTVGLVPKMAELAAALPVNLAVSLNATTEQQRRQIMPITRKHSLAELVEACRSFPLPPGKRITFEYVMLGGFNDTLDDAERLFGLLQGIPAKVNLIPYNENPHRDLKRPSDATVKAFQHYFVSRGRSCAIRTTRGIDISAACGQLGTAAARVAG
jgi:23S rRNA (adenine2503-C2)-methyltransferase